MNLKRSELFGTALLTSSYPFLFTPEGEFLTDDSFHQSKSHTQKPQGRRWKFLCILTPINILVAPIFY